MVSVDTRGKRSSWQRLNELHSSILISVKVLNIKLNLDGQGRQPPAVTAQPPTAQPPAASHQLFAAIAASRLHT
jgi:hypothetical protein